MAVINISEAAKGIYQIDINTEEAGLPGAPTSSTVYFIAGDKTAIVETGPTAVAPIVIDAIRQLKHDPLRLDYIILTHIHVDHGGGAGALAKQLPQVKVLVHPRGARHLVDPSRLITATGKVYGEGFQTEYGPILPVAADQVQGIEENEIISLGDKKLRIIHTPGHAPHHMCIYDSDSRGVFSGDALGSLVRFANMAGRPQSGDFDLVDTLTTIEKLTKLDLKFIFYSHGGASSESNGLVQALYNNTKAYGEIIRAAMRAGEDKEQMRVKVEAYQKEFAPSEYAPGDPRTDGLVNRYVNYFQRKGIR